MSDHRRLMRRELVRGLYASRTVGRRDVLFALESSQILSEALFPSSVLSASASQLLALVQDWTWP